MNASGAVWSMFVSQDHALAKWAELTGLALGIKTVKDIRK
jgi:hypothetical protein